MYVYVYVCVNVQEAEFRAYFIAVFMADQSSRQSIVAALRSLPTSVSQHPMLVHILKMFGAFVSDNSIHFWKLVKDPATTPVLACLLSRLFPIVRAKQLEQMNTGFSQANVTVADVKRMLFLPSKERAIQYCQHHGIPITRGIVEFKKAPFQFPKPDRYVKRFREPQLVHDDTLASTLRKDLVDVNLWAATCDAAVFAPSGSTSGIIPSHVGLALGRVATDLYPGAEYSVQRQYAPAFVATRARHIPVLGDGRSTSSIAASRPVPAVMPRMAPVPPTKGTVVSTKKEAAHGKEEKGKATAAGKAGTKEKGKGKGKVDTEPGTGKGTTPLTAGGTSVSATASVSTAQTTAVSAMSAATSAVGTSTAMNPFAAVTSGASEGGTATTSTISPFARKPPIMAVESASQPAFTAAASISTSVAAFTGVNTSGPATSPTLALSSRSSLPPTSLAASAVSSVPRRAAAPPVVAVMSAEEEAANREAAVAEITRRQKAHRERLRRRVVQLQEELRTVAAKTVQSIERFMLKRWVKVFQAHRSRKDQLISALTQSGQKRKYYNLFEAPRRVLPQSPGMGAGMGLNPTAIAKQLVTSYSPIDVVRCVDRAIYQHHIQQLMSLHLDTAYVKVVVCTPSGMLSHAGKLDKGVLAADDWCCALLRPVGTRAQAEITGLHSFTRTSTTLEASEALGEEGRDASIRLNISLLHINSECLRMNEDASIRANLLGMQSLLFIVHVNVVENEDGKSTYTLHPDDAAAKRLGSVLLSIVPDGYIALQIGVILHPTYADGGNKGAGSTPAAKKARTSTLNTLGSPSTTSTDIIEITDKEQPGDQGLLDFIGTALSVNSLPRAIVSQAHIHVLNPSAHADSPNLHLEKRLLEDSLSDCVACIDLNPRCFRITLPFMLRFVLSRAIEQLQVMPTHPSQLVSQVCHALRVFTDVLVGLGEESPSPSPLSSGGLQGLLFQTAAVAVPPELRDDDMEVETPPNDVDAFARKLRDAVDHFVSLLGDNNEENTVLDAHMPPTLASFVDYWSHVVKRVVAPSKKSATVCNEPPSFKSYPIPSNLFHPTKAQAATVRVLSPIFGWSVQARGVLQNILVSEIDAKVGQPLDLSAITTAFNAVIATVPGLNAQRRCMLSLARYIFDDSVTADELTVEMPIHVFSTALTCMAEVIPTSSSATQGIPATPAPDAAPVHTQGAGGDATGIDVPGSVGEFAGLLFQFIQAAAVPNPRRPSDAMHNERVLGALGFSAQLSPHGKLPQPSSTSRIEQVALDRSILPFEANGDTDMGMRMSMNTGTRVGPGLGLGLGMEEERRGEDARADGITPPGFDTIAWLQREMAEEAAESASLTQLLEYTLSSSAPVDTYTIRSLSTPAWAPLSAPQQSAAVPTPATPSRTQTVYEEPHQDAGANEPTLEQFMRELAAAKAEYAILESTLGAAIDTEDIGM
jgi:hypothetical protein